jgi:hypothetical protein
VPKFRSPVLGFNHNVRHQGWVFHVQTEDSGIASPHIFTHLFHGGVIFSTKKMVYDAESDVDVVKGLMQAQHKSVLKELKSGSFDAKIKQYLGEAPPGGEPMPSDQMIHVASGASAVPNRIPDDAAAATIPVGPPSGMDASVPEYDDMEVEAARSSPSVAQPLPPPPGVDEADVSAAFRALAGPVSGTASTQPIGTVPGLSNLPAPAQPTPPTPPPTIPPGTPPTSSTAWVATRPGVQERPFQKSGQFQTIATDPGTPRPVSEQGSGPKRTPSPGTQPPIARPSTPAPTTQRPAGAKPTPQPAPPQPAQPRGRPTGDGVIVARPAVIIGAPPQVIGGGGARPTPGTTPPGTIPPARRTGGVGPREAQGGAGDSSIFGKDLISEKSLDEVIMAYLSEDTPEE